MEESQQLDVLLQQATFELKNGSPVVKNLYNTLIINYNISKPNNIRNFNVL